MFKNKSVLIKNIYYMLSYAFSCLDETGYEDIATEEYDNVQNLIASVLSRGVGRQLKRGLFREYVKHEESSVSMRGKLHMRDTIANRLARKRCLACEYDELSEDNLLNQIIKTSAELLIRNGDVDIQYRIGLEEKMRYFTGVHKLDPENITWNSIRFHRNNDSYRMLIGICQLLLQGMLLTTDSGEMRLATFADDQSMSRLYEKFVLEFFMKECPQVNTAPRQISWALDDDIRTLLPTMRSDIVLSRDNRVLIIDAKYYTHTTQTYFDVHSVHSGNLYQIFTYVKNMAAAFKDKPHTVSGMLLYAQTEEEIQPRATYSMSGNQIEVRTLNLNLPFPQIAEQLKQIVADHFSGQYP